MEPTDQNRRAWDEIHRSRTRAASEQLLIPEQIFDLIPDVEGKHVLHLQCATVFTGGDVLSSIRDLDQWLAGIATTMKPGGMLLLYDSHPVTERVDPLGHWRDNYFDSSDERAWRLEEVVNAVIGAGLRVTRLAEFQTLIKGLQRDRRVPWDFAVLATKPE